MSERVAILVEAALQLNRSERTELVQQLVATDDPDFSPTQLAELNRRISEWESGAVQGIPWETVREQGRKRYGL